MENVPTTPNDLDDPLPPRELEQLREMAEANEPATVSPRGARKLGNLAMAGDRGIDTVRDIQTDSESPPSRVTRPADRKKSHLQGKRQKLAASRERVASMPLAIQGALFELRRQAMGARGSRNKADRST